MSAVSLVPTAVITSGQAIGCDIRLNAERGIVEATHTGLPRPQLHIVIFRGSDSVFHSAERCRKTANAVENPSPEREVRADEANCTFTATDDRLIAVVLKRQRRPVRVGKPTWRRRPPVGEDAGR